MTDHVGETFSDGLVLDGVVNADDALHLEWPWKFEKELGEH